MKKKSLISIIIPVTRANLLDICIQSLTNNDLSNCEIIFHFNGISKSKRLIKKIKLKLEKKCNNLIIKFAPVYLRIYKNWERAISYHQGDWVMFLCEDDLIYFGAIQNLENMIKKYKNFNCFFWNTSLYTYNHDNGILKVAKETYATKAKLKIFKSKDVLRKIFKDSSVHKVKKDLPYIPASLIKSKIIKKTNNNFFFNEEPMWASAFQVLNSEKNYMRVPFVVTVIGELKNSNSIRQTQLSKGNKNKLEVNKFDKSFSVKFKCSSKIFTDIDYGMFIKFNRFIGFEIIMQSHEKFKNFKQYKCIVDKKKILEDVYFEALERNSESTIFSYFSELKILRKKIDTDLRLMYQEFKILIINRVYKFFFRKDLSLRYFRTFKNLDKLNIKTVLKNIEK